MIKIKKFIFYFVLFKFIKVVQIPNAKKTLLIRLGITEIKYLFITFCFVFFSIHYFFLVLF